MDKIGLKLEKIQVRFHVFDNRMLEKIELLIEDSLSSDFPQVEFVVDQDIRDGEGYYSGIRFQMYAHDRIGTNFFLVDGGFTDWTQKLLSNNKERLLISGMGSERLLACFGSGC